MEIRNSEGDVTREFQFEENQAEWDYRYFYRNRILTRVEIWYRGPPSETEQPVFTLMYTDLYRYSRSGSIRAVDRTLHQGALESLRIGFPNIGPGIPFSGELISHGSIYTSEYFAGAESSEDVTVSFTLDHRERVLTEVWRDEDGEILGELINTWAGDRLQSIMWKSDTDERLIEFEYDNDGNRVVERNFRNGLLERSVTAQDGLDVEEIFMNGRLILRAFWENGIKISEERISPARRSP
jgi:hypothetical protein